MHMQPIQLPCTFLRRPVWLAPSDVGIAGSADQLLGVAPLDIIKKQLPDWRKAEVRRALEKQAHCVLYKQAHCMLEKQAHCMLQLLLWPGTKHSGPGVPCSVPTYQLMLLPCARTAMEKSVCWSSLQRGCA
jgi:hypothetical protein